MARQGRGLDREGHPRGRPGHGDIPWNRRLTLKLLREEAEAMLKTASPVTAQPPKPAAKEKEKAK